MSRSKKKGKPPGYDFWGRRPLSGQGSGKKLKKWIHKIERLNNKQLARKERNEHET